MDDDSNDRMMKESCSLCRWARQSPEPQDATGYFCGRSQVFISWGEIDQGLCLGFQR